MRSYEDMRKRRTCSNGRSFLVRGLKYISKCVKVLINNHVSIIVTPLRHFVPVRFLLRSFSVVAARRRQWTLSNYRFALSMRPRRVIDNSWFRAAGRAVSFDMYVFSSAFSRSLTCAAFVFSLFLFPLSFFASLSPLHFFFLQLFFPQLKRTNRIVRC